MSAYFVKLTANLPPFALEATLLFHPVNNSVTLLISIILSQALADFLVTLSHIFPHAVFAPGIQPISISGTFSELNLVFPPFAFSTAFLLHAFNCAVTLLITVVSLCHCLLVPT